MDHAVGGCSRLLEPVEIIEITATHLCAKRSERLRRTVRPGQRSDLVAGGDEVGDDVWTGMTGPASDEYVHVGVPCK